MLYLYVREGYNAFNDFNLLEKEVEEIWEIWEIKAARRIRRNPQNSQKQKKTQKRKNRERVFISYPQCCCHVLLIYVRLDDGIDEIFAKFVVNYSVDFLMSSHSPFTFVF
jgi:hypothetical protein